MIDDVFEWLVIALLVIHAVRATKHCEDQGWAINGVKPSGDFECLSPSPRCCGEPVGPCEKPCPRRRRKYDRIYCTNGAKPIVVDYRTVGCRR